MESLEEAGGPGSAEEPEQPASAATSSGEESNESTGDPLADYFVRHKARPAWRRDGDRRRRGKGAQALARAPRPARSRLPCAPLLPLQVAKNDTLEGLAVKYNVTVRLQPSNQPTNSPMSRRGRWAARRAWFSHTWFSLLTSCRAGASMACRYSSALCPHYLRPCHMPPTRCRLLRCSGRQVSDIKRANALLADTAMFAKDTLLIPTRPLPIGCVAGAAAGAERSGSCWAPGHACAQSATRLAVLV